MRFLLLRSCFAARLLCLGRALAQRLPCVCKAFVALDVSKFLLFSVCGICAGRSPRVSRALAVRLLGCSVFTGRLPRVSRAFAAAFAWFLFGFLLCACQACAMFVRWLERCCRAFSERLPFVC